MERYTQRQIRQMVAAGIADDLGKAHEEHAETTGERYIPGLSQVGYSAGAYGINGALFVDGEGRVYGIVGRSSTLFTYA